MEEGYIKYHLDWVQGPPLPIASIDALNTWRKRMYDVGLIGHYEELGVGYGNISVRCQEGEGCFIISGTQTGHLPVLDERHYSLVTAYDIGKNRLTCTGPIKASSEALTHAAVYALSPSYQAVIHIHSRRLWEALMCKLPTTAETVPYGTPEMAYEVKRLYEATDLAEQRLLVMAGHEEGLVAFGEGLDEAGGVVDKLT